MTLEYTVQPLTDFSIFTTVEPRPIPFKASWRQTLTELGRELSYLDAERIILELDVSPSRIRRDGLLYADAKVGHRGVRLSFESRHGQLAYTCDTYEGRWSGDMPDWQANVRAIRLTLEALRAVDRYGATQGEQYAGFKALEARPAGIGREAALEILRTIAGPMDDEQALYRRARGLAHPDRHAGERKWWDQVEAAGRALGLAS